MKSCMFSEVTPERFCVRLDQFSLKCDWLQTLDFEELQSQIFGAEPSLSRL